MSLEARAIEFLKKDLPGLRKRGLRQTMRDAYNWIYKEVGREGDEFDEDDFEWEMGRVGEHWPRPNFIPDATRFRKCRLKHSPETLAPCVEIWEIEDTSPITAKKLFDIKRWIFLNWDEAIYPHFELWRTDRWGQSRFRVISTAEDHYGVELIDLEEQEIATKVIPITRQDNGFDFAREGLEPSEMAAGLGFPFLNTSRATESTESASAAES